MPIQIFPIQSTSPITFRHPSISQALKIGTGVDQIGWAYNLNTNVESTYGGEVVQVLSAYVDAITVSGQTQDNVQLRQIYDWFLEYMQLAGLHNRDEHFITMEYPERGWSFWIQVTDAPNFTYNRDLIAVEWQIKAEIVADNDLNVLSQMTMSAYTEAAFDPSMWDMKFMAHDKRNDHIHLNPALGLKIGENFQSMLGAWATGDFAHWAFDATADRADNHLGSAREYWTQIYGTDAPFASAGQGGGGNTGSIGNPTGRSDVAFAISQAASARSIEGYIMVASSLVETGGTLSPDARQSGGDSAMGLFQTFPDGAGGSGPHADEVRAAFAHPGDKVTKYYPSGHQITDAAGWWNGHAKRAPGEDPGSYAKRCQGAGDSLYANKVNAQVDAAKALIRQGGSGSAKGRLALQYARTQLGVPYRWGGESPGSGFDCSGLTEWAYSKAGVTIPRTAALQQTFVIPVPQSGLQEGDLIFQGRPAHHVVMYAGNGKVIAAPHTGAVVSIEDANYFLTTDSGGQGRVPT